MISPGASNAVICLDRRSRIQPSWAVNGLDCHRWRPPSQQGASRGSIVWSRMVWGLGLFLRVCPCFPSGVCDLSMPSAKRVMERSSEQELPEVVPGKYRVRRDDQWQVHSTTICVQPISGTSSPCLWSKSTIVGSSAAAACACAAGKLAGGKKSSHSGLDCSPAV
jgi:hypothetical protein